MCSQPPRLANLCVVQGTWWVRSARESRLLRFTRILVYVNHYIYICFIARGPQFEAQCRPKLIAELHFAKAYVRTV